MRPEADLARARISLRGKKRRTEAELDFFSVAQTTGNEAELDFSVAQTTRNVAEDSQRTSAAGVDEDSGTKPANVPLFPFPIFFCCLADTSTRKVRY